MKRFWLGALVGLNCSPARESDITQFRLSQGLEELPSSYEGFLRVAGAGCGELWVGSDVFLPHRFDLREAAEELLAENGVDSDVLQAHDLVIGMHQGYQFLYLSSLSSDPPVFRWSEGGGVQQVGASFTSFVLDLLPS